MATGTSTGSIVITLYPDFRWSTQPLVAQGPLSSIPLLSLSTKFGTGNSGIVDIQNVNFTGLANTNYWVGFSTTGVSSLNAANVVLDVTMNLNIGPSAAFPTTLVAVSLPNYIELCVSSDFACGTTALAGFPASLKVFTTQAPEPASLAILGSALTGLGILRRRRAKKAMEV